MILILQLLCVKRRSFIQAVSDTPGSISNGFPNTFVGFVQMTMTPDYLGGIKLNIHCTARRFRYLRH